MSSLSKMSSLSISNVDNNRFWQRKSRDNGSVSFLRRLRVVGLFVVASALVLAGCGEPAPLDTAPPAQKATINNLVASNATLAFDLTNPNSEEVQVQIALSPSTDGVMVTVDGSSVALAEVKPISLAATGSDGSTKPVRITALENSTEYTVTVTTSDTSNNAQTDTATMSATPLAAAGTPVGFTATPGDAEVVLAWTQVTGATGYKVYRAVGSVVIPSATTLITTTTLGSTVTTYTDTTPTNDTQYAYIVTAVNANSDETPSAVDTTTPLAFTNAPASLTVAPRDGEVILTWTAPASGGVVAEYRIYRATGSATATRLVTSPATLLPATLTYTDSTAVNGTTYTYAVRTANANRTESPNSTTRPATPLAPAASPTLTANAGIAEVSLSWNAVTGATQYKVYRATGTTVATSDTLATTVTAPIASYDDTGLTNGTQYAYIVVAVNTNSAETPSAVQTATPLARPDIPASLTATAIPAGGQVTLTWTAPASSDVAVTEYRIYRAEGSAIGPANRLVTTPPTLPSSTLTYADIDVVNGTTYTYTILAVNANGAESPNSPLQTVTPLAPLDAPTLTIDPGDAEVSLSWNAITGATQYKVYRATGVTTFVPASGTVVATISNPATITYNDTGRVNGTQYAYIVAAVNANGVEVYSSVQATIPLPIPGAPTLTATAGDTTASLSWGTVANATQYKIYRAAGPTVVPSSTTLIATVDSPAITYTDTARTNDIQYAYIVASANANDDGTNSAVQTATPLAPAGAPASSTATPSDGEVVLAWTPPSGGVTVTEYRIYRTTGSSIGGSPTRLTTTTLPPATRTYTDSTVTNGEEYIYAVRAVNTNGDESANSTAGPVTPLAPLGAPASLTATAGTGQVNLVWTAPTGSVPVSGYNVYRATGDSLVGSLTKLTANPTTSPHLDTTADNNIEYTYTVRSVNANGTESANSTTVTATPLASPGVPTDFTATAGTGEVNLAWTAWTSAAGGVAVSGYHVYRADGSNIGGATRITTSLATTPYMDTTAANNIEYAYAVRSVNANGTESANSTTVTATPLASPGVPASLTATAGTGEVNLVWTAPSSNVPPVSGYNVYRATGSSLVGSLTKLTANPTTSPHLDTTADNNIEYTYAVRSVNTNGTESANSITRTATPLALLGAPTGLDAMAGTGRVVLTWVAPAGSVDGYNIYRFAGSDISMATQLVTFPTTLSSTTLTYTDSTAANGAAYIYAVRAVNGNGAEGANSNSQTATPLAAPGAPATLTATSGNGQITLAWTAPTSGATVSRYHVYRAEGSNTPTRLTTAPVLLSTTLTYIDRTAVNNTIYTYAVRAVNRNGTDSANSITRTATPLALPGAPATLAVTSGVGIAMLTWTAPASNVPAVDEYRIYRAGGGATVARLDTTPATLLPATLTYEDSGLTDGATYTYTIRAVNANGVESVDSPTGTATPLALPGVPAALTAASGNGQVILTWTASTGSVSEYRIYRATGRDIGTARRLATTPDATLSPSTLTYTDSTADNGIEYIYAVRAMNANSVESANSPTATVTPLALLDAPTGLTAVAGVGQVVLAWIAPAGSVTEYRILRTISSTTTQIATPTTLTYTDSSVTNGGIYTYTVLAVNANNAEGAMSAAIMAIPRALLVAPTGLTATAEVGQVVLVWNAVGGVSEYRIYRAIGTATATLLTNPSSTTLTYTDSTVANGTMYNYTVLAVNANNAEGANSNTATATLTPDLNILTRTLGRDFAVLGTALQISVKVRNKGNAPSSATTMGFQIGSVDLVNTVTVPMIAAGAEMTFMPSNITVPSGTTLGTYVLQVTVVAVAGETDTSNNTKDILTNFVVRAPSDLIIKSFAVAGTTSATTVASGGTFMPTVVVRNDGLGLSSGVTFLEFNLQTISSDPLTVVKTMLMGTIAVPVIAATTDLASLFRMITVPSIVAGTYHMTVKVTEVYGESDGNNNSATLLDAADMPIVFTVN